LSDPASRKPTPLEKRCKPSMHLDNDVHTYSSMISRKFFVSHGSDDFKLFEHDKVLLIGQAEPDDRLFSFRINLVHEGDLSGLLLVCKRSKGIISSKAPKQLRHKISRKRKIIWLRVLTKLARIRDLPPRGRFD